MENFCSGPGLNCCRSPELQPLPLTGGRSSPGRGFENELLRETLLTRPRGDGPFPQLHERSNCPEWNLLVPNGWVSYISAQWLFCHCYLWGKGRAAKEVDESGVKQKGNCWDQRYQGLRNAKIQLMNNDRYNSKHPSATSSRETPLTAQKANRRLGCGDRSLTLALWGRFIMVSGLKSFLFFLHRTAVMMMMITVTTAMGASTAAMIHRLFGGFFTTATGNRKPTLVSFTGQTQDLVASNTVCNSLHLITSIKGLSVI